MDAHHSTGPTVNLVCGSCMSQPLSESGLTTFQCLQHRFLLRRGIGQGCRWKLFWSVGSLLGRCLASSFWLRIEPRVWEDIILISERGGCHLLNSVSWWSHLLWTRLSPALASEGGVWSRRQQQQVECKPGTAVRDAHQMLMREHPGRLPDSLGGCQGKILGGKI